jgi:hypothetical protein
MRLFNRKRQQESLCPRCSQIVRDADGLTCPMCGWDLCDAYQGGASAPDDSHGADTTTDRPV